MFAHAVAVRRASEPDPCWNFRYIIPTSDMLSLGWRCRFRRASTSTKHPSIKDNKTTADPSCRQLIPWISFQLQGLLKFAGQTAKQLVQKKDVCRDELETSSSERLLETATWYMLHACVVVVLSVCAR